MTFSGVAKKTSDICSHAKATHVLKFIPFFFKNLVLKYFLDIVMTCVFINRHCNKRDFEDVAQQISLKHLK